MTESSVTDMIGAVVISDLRRPGSDVLLGEVSALFPTVIQPPIWIESSGMDDSTVVDRGRFRARHLREPLRGEVGTALAHRGVYQTLLGREGTWWIVFEDDTVILDGANLKTRVHQIVTRLRRTEPTIVNLNHRAARQRVWSRRSDVPGLWRPFAPTYTAASYLINREAARRIVQAQTPIQAQTDWPIDCREILFLQETAALVEPRSDLLSIVDPEGLRSQTPALVRLQTWSWLWYARNRTQFSGPSEYWHGVLLPRLMRHLHQNSVAESD